MVAQILPVSSAFAADVYVSSAFGCSNNWGGGQFDQNGTTYVSCGKNVYRTTLAGAVLPVVLLPNSSAEVAPSPTGDIIYYINADGTVNRMVKQADGTFLRDANWVTEPFDTNGVLKPIQTKYIQTDAWGDIYISNGGWYTNAQTVMLKYGPNGKYKTRFGDWGMAAGQFNVNMGFTVSRDGRTIYTTENVNGRIQRFDYSTDGTYRFTMTWGTTDSVNCSVGNFAAPYDISMDPWGDLYVQDTSCQRIQKFGPTGISKGVLGSLPVRSHCIVVDGHGNFIVGQSNLKFTRQSPDPGPWPAITPLPLPDTAAPVLNNVMVPTVTYTRDITVDVEATDNDRVSQVRIANEDGNWGEWTAVVPAQPHTLTAGYATKAVTVQVRDLAGNESNVMTRTTSYRAEPVIEDTTAPVVSDVTVPATTTVRDIQVGVTATDAVGVTKMRFANEDGAWGAWIDFAVTANWTLSAGYATKGIFTQVRDAAGNESAAVYRTLQYAAPVPVGDIADPIISEVAAPTVTATRDITMAITATDDIAVTQARFANEDGNWGAWVAIAPELAWTLTNGYGDKAVFTQVRDAAGRTSNTVLSRLKYLANAPAGGGNDAVAPVLTEAAIPAATTTQAINVAITATDNVAVSQARFANEDGNWGPWVAFAAELPWTLSAGYGNKAIFVQVRDGSGNESNTLVRRTSVQQVLPPAGVVDAAAPVLVAVALDALVATSDVTIGLEATDDVAVTQVRFANEDGNWGVWIAFAPEVEWMLTAGYGDKAVFTQVRDAAGNESNTVLTRTKVQ